MELPEDLRKKREFLSPHSIEEYQIWKDGFNTCYSLLSKTDNQTKELLGRIQHALMAYGESKARSGIILEECVEKLKQILKETNV